jgi:hypothetical protein
MKRSHDEAFSSDLGFYPLADDQEFGFPPKNQPPNHSSTDDKQHIIDEESKFCSRCEKVDFERIFAIPSWKLGHGGLAVTEHRKDVGLACSLCVLIFFLDPPELR